MNVGLKLTGLPLDDISLTSHTVLQHENHLIQIISLKILKKAIWKKLLKK